MAPDKNKFLERGGALKKRKTVGQFDKKFRRPNVFQ